MTKTNLADVEVVYFGCWDVTGHSYYRPNGRGPKVKSYADFKNVTPWGNGIDGMFTPKRRTRQGDAALHHVDGWTVLAIHDYTVDSRGGSHSTFAFESPRLLFSEAVEVARRDYPTVMERIGPICLVEKHTQRVTE